MSPARLYLLTSVLFFFMLSVFGGSDEDDQADRSEVFQVQIDNAIEENQAQQAIDGSDSEGSADDDAEEEDSQNNPDILRPLLNKAQTASLDRILAQQDNAEKMLALEGLAKTVTSVQQQAPEDSEWWLRTFIGKTVVALEDPKELRRAFIDNVPLSMFVLLPAYALLLKLLFYRRKPPIYYAEHFVFALYLHVLAFLIFSMNLLVPQETWYETPLMIGTILYLGYYSYRSMRVYYERSKWRTVWRFGVLGLGYLLLFIPAFSVVMVYSFIAF